jgi:prepilin-type N-terminal cleavage/methylation domain-containing protein
MVGTKKSERIILRAYLPRLPLRLTSHQGFSLIELSIVLIIIGLILGAGVTVWRSSIDSTRLSTTKTNLDNIKNSVINFAIANGRLACPDSTVPPNNTGQSNPAGAGVCAGCANPPCWIPYQTLQLQLPRGMDSFGNVFRYDISYDTAGGAQGGLTNTTQDTFCGVLFEYLFHATDVGVLRVPCVTNQNDGADNGQIGAAGQGYGAAAVAISETPVDSFFNAPAGLTGKNIAGTPREYEMAGRANDNTYGNLISELTYGELYNKVCATQKTKIRIQNYTGALQYVKIAGTGACLQVSTVPIGYVDLYQGNTVTFYTDATCGTTCTGTSTFTFNMSAAPSDAGNVDWNGAGIYGRDGRVQITGTCATTLTLSDNTNPAP